MDEILQLSAKRYRRGVKIWLNRVWDWTEDVLIWGWKWLGDGNTKAKYVCCELFAADVSHPKTVHKRKKPFLDNEYSILTKNSKYNNIRRK